MSLVSEILRVRALLLSLRPKSVNVKYKIIQRISNQNNKGSRQGEDYICKHEEPGNFVTPKLNRAKVFPAMLERNQCVSFKDGASYCYCASRDIRVSIGICSPIQQCFCAVCDYVEKADLSKGYQNPKRKLGVTTHFSAIIELKFGKKLPNIFLYFNGFLELRLLN